MSVRDFAQHVGPSLTPGIEIDRSYFGIVLLRLIRHAVIQYQQRSFQFITFKSRKLTGASLQINVGDQDPIRSRKAVRFQVPEVGLSFRTFVVVRSMSSASWRIAATFAMWLQVIGGESQMLRPDL